VKTRPRKKSVTVAQKPTRSHRFIIVTGLSGSGKSHAIRALEDLGYFCIDNLPTQLIQTVAELARREDAGLSKIAIVVDIREGAFLQDFPKVYRKLKGLSGVSPMLVFLEANDAALLRRFSETRRPHPLAKERSVGEGILEERKKLNLIRRMANLIIDTTNLTVHDLRNAFVELSRGTGRRADLVVNLLSFGYKYGVPLDSDLIFDVRCLPNPHFVERLRNLTGRDRPVSQYMRRSPETREFIDQLALFLKFSLPHYVREGKTYLTIGLGCTGGRHRSVMVAESLKKTLAGVARVTLRVTHRDS
tara:strand:+ start:3669 stop:4580 length:912 start_codon:yes stop_codon:yes gene_type:complete